MQVTWLLKWYVIRDEKRSLTPLVGGVFRYFLISGLSKVGRAI